MPLTTRDLYEAGLNSDAITGFEAQVALRKARFEAQPPEHFAGCRVTEFLFGAQVARTYMVERASVGHARRRVRAREARETGGMMTVLRAGNAGELREEQAGTVRAVVERIRKVSAEIAAEAGDAPFAPGP